jgi:hypothetical protein
MDTNVLVGTCAAGTAAVASIVSAFLVIFHGGRQVGKVEAAISRLVGIEAKVDIIPELEVRIGQQEEVTLRLRSDHKDLAVRVDRVVEGTAEMRGRFQSQHDR